MTDTIMALPGFEGAAVNPLDDSQLKSAEARALFESANGEQAWMSDYFDLVAEGWSWRQACYILWASMPKAARNPKTQMQLATDVLGLASDRVIREWRDKNPAIDLKVRHVQTSLLNKHRAEILQALVDSASEPNPRNHPDRKLALEMLGDYVPKAAVGIGTPDDLREATTEELLALLNAPIGEA